MILPDGYDELVPDAWKPLVDCGVLPRQQAVELVELLPVLRQLAEKTPANCRKKAWFRRNDVPVPG